MSWQAEDGSAFPCGAYGRTFPTAKFVHIRRDSYAVFSSTRHMFRVNEELNRLQRARAGDLDEWILRQYRVMYDVYFEERRLMPAGNFIEV